MIGNAIAPVRTIRLAAEREATGAALAGVRSRRGQPVDVSDSAMRELADRLETLRTACGCRTGEVATLIGIGAVFVTWATGVWFGSPSSFATGVVVSAGVVVIAGIAGKLLGITVARTRRRLLARRFHIVLPR